MQNYAKKLASSDNSKPVCESEPILCSLGFVLNVCEQQRHQYDCSGRSKPLMSHPLSTVLVRHGSVVVMKTVLLIKQ